MLCGKKPTICNYFFDKAKISVEKTKTKQHGVEFVSTNDILSSTFGSVTGARIMLLPLNFRGRNPEFTADDAGNYEGALAFGPSDYDSPSLVRKTLQSGPPTFLRGGGVVAALPLPGGWAATRCRLSMCVNWTFPHFTQFDIEGCHHLLHTPHADTKMVPFDTAVVYCPRAGEIAAVFFTRSVDEADLKAELPLGDAVVMPDY
mmetsp:Transcript_17350/g.35759  ORF Transcript_17350/g.35759 Transcript_17350/m.35759 type:complete len:203 (+) Transcript_17350:790-1398(+)